MTKKTGGKRTLLEVYTPLTSQRRTARKKPPKEASHAPNVQRAHTPSRLVCASHQEAAEQPRLSADEAEHEDGVDAEEVRGIPLGRRVPTQREYHLRVGGIAVWKGVRECVGSKGG